MPKYGSCLLGSLNLAEFININNNEIDYNELKEAVSIAIKGLHDVLIEGMPLHPLKEQQLMVNQWRQMGLGVMGIADMFIKLKIKYGSAESKCLLQDIMQVILDTAVRTSAFIPGDVILTEKQLKQSPLYKLLSDETKHIIHLYGGIKHSQLLTIAPTGTLSTMLNISGGIEPLFALEYTRTTKSLHGKDVTYKVYPKIVEEELKKNIKLGEHFISSEDIKPFDRIDTQAAAQRSIDAAISSTINLPETATIQDVYDIYMQAWKRKLKGVTIFRSGCKRVAILNTKVVNSQPTVGHQKRPRDLHATCYVVKSKNKCFSIVVGILNNKPYEVFCYNGDIGNSEGIITKKKKHEYVYTTNGKSYHLVNDNLPEEFKLPLELETATLYISMLMRHNVDLSYIIKTARKGNPNIASYTNALCRVLSKYVVDTSTECCPECKEGKMINENGCKHCDSCGYSACG